jgi:hypothetical protein
MSMAIPYPSWLPNKVSVNGEWTHVLMMLYSIFEEDFIRAERSFRSRPIWWNRTLLPGSPYEEGFWHLIEKEQPKLGQRVFDPRRAEKLPWCGPSITNADDPIITLFFYREGNSKLRVYIWLESYDYVVILEKQKMRLGDVFFLVTAYHVSGEGTRRNLQRKYERREAL